MKITYDNIGAFKLEVSQESAMYDGDGRDMAFLENLICNIPKEDRKILSKYIRIDMVSGCILKEGIPAKDCTIEDVIDTKEEEKTGNTETWDGILSIEFNPLGMNLD